MLAVATSLTALSAGVIALARMRDAPPTLDAGTVVMSTVSRGELVREVLGHGVLAPEELQWVVATMPGRVKRVLVRPGAEVHASDVLVELDNADLELSALEAERQLASAEADLVSQRASITGQILAADATLAQLRGDVAQATRRDAASETLVAGGLLSRLDGDDARDRRRGLADRVAAEERRRDALAGSERDLAAAGRRQVERFRAISAFRRDQLAALRVVGAADGTVVEMSIEPGQWVVPGTVIAKIARPGRLKAEIRVAETLARDVEIGQAVRVDTRAAMARGHVAHVDPAVRGGAIRVDVVFDGGPPAGARPDQSVDGIVEIERAADVLRLTRPALAQPGRAVALFRVDPRTGEARRTRVELGRASIDSIEIKSGLAEGDRVIVSDTTSIEESDRLRLR